VIIGEQSMTKKQLSTEDLLKNVEDICVADVRSKFSNTTLENRHKVIAQIKLSQSTPIPVQTHFETAKNLSLYSWFVYRFHQISELASYTTLEMALKYRYEQETENEPDKKKRRLMTLNPLLKHAQEHGWIRNDGFPRRYNQAHENARTKKAYHKQETWDFEVNPSMPIDEPTEEEVKEALEAMDITSTVTEVTHKLRNSLAHSPTMLHPGSVSTLVFVSEIINQLYDD
jgi:hypothetical protein